MIALALRSIPAWTEDRATQRCDPSAAPGAKTEERPVRSHATGRPSPLRDWRPRDKPSRHDAATSSTGCPSPLANVRRYQFQFTVNQDTCGGPCGIFSFFSLAEADGAKQLQPKVIRLEQDIRVKILKGPGPQNERSQHWTTPLRFPRSSQIFSRTRPDGEQPTSTSTR